MARKPLKSEHSVRDFRQASPAALLPLIPYLKPEWTVWDCAAGQARFVRALLNHGFTAFGTDVLTGQDFLTWLPQDDWDCIVSEPPLSRLTGFFQQAYALGKPFAFLCDTGAFGGLKRRFLFRSYGVELIILPGQLENLGEGAKRVEMTWFTHGLNMGKELTFAEHLV